MHACTCTCTCSFPVNFEQMCLINVEDSHNELHYRVHVVFLCLISVEDTSSHNELHVDRMCLAHLHGLLLLL